MTDKTDSKEREAFEAWCVTQGWVEKPSARPNGTYINGALQARWLGWIGRASLAASAGSEPVAWKHDCAALMTNDVELWIDSCIHCGKPRKLATQSTHQSPPEGMVGGWTKASQQLPPCRDDQLYLGVNFLGFAGVFNAVADVDGCVHCMYETPEETIDVMSGLDIWQPFSPPTMSADSGKGE